MNILITSAWPNYKKFDNDLKEFNSNISFVEDNVTISEELASNIEYIICNSFFLHNELSMFPKLKAIQVTSAGLDRLPLEEIKERNIKIFNGKGVYSIPIAEFVVSSILDIYKDKFGFYLKQKERKWEKNKNLEELFSKKIIIFGCGDIGREIAKRLASFGCIVDGVEQKPSSIENFNKVFSSSETEKIIGNYDVIISCLPLTDKTMHFFNEKKLKLIKNEGIFVNVSRGKIVDEKALVKRLMGGMKAAILDVFEEEPLNNGSTLWKMDNVLISPHNSFASVANEERLSKIILKNLKEIR